MYLALTFYILGMVPTALVGMLVRETFFPTIKIWQVVLTAALWPFMSCYVSLFVVAKVAVEVAKA